ncbi:helix-turn-helix transcriptional regulator [Iamia majanohamensis]|uniref:Helix-turn-helix transcriptional regulator n=1 Tax=Iamia majanohamensis TaxID=467976 RepID=A0AAE9Y557_9ACTN|nr:helix-turn-helix transcriptional regulator [Iamia majanohamensis]WCO66555.1 helix-turn-helix transcriptional regulator [Iamia majanohamensis]
MAPDTLGQRVRRERLARQITQRELAGAIDVGVPYISKIEADRETPADDKITKLARALDIEPDELLLTARRVPADVLERLASDPARGLEFLRTWKD